MFSQVAGFSHVLIAFKTELCVTTVIFFGSFLTFSQAVITLETKFFPLSPSPFSPSTGILPSTKRSFMIFLASGVSGCPSSLPIFIVLKLASGVTLLVISLSVFSPRICVTSSAVTYFVPLGNLSLSSSTSINGNFSCPTFRVGKFSMRFLSYASLLRFSK